MPTGEDPVENMQARAAQCRRLADLTHDRSMADQLRQWASEIEADIRRLHLERAKNDGSVVRTSEQDREELN